MLNRVSEERDRLEREVQAGRAREAELKRRLEDAEGRLGDAERERERERRDLEAGFREESRNSSVRSSESAPRRPTSSVMVGGLLSRRGAENLQEVVRLPNGQRVYRKPRGRG